MFYSCYAAFKGSSVPNFHRSRAGTLLFTDWPEGHNVLMPYHSVMQYLYIMIMTVGLILLL